MVARQLAEFGIVSRVNRLLLGAEREHRGKPAKGFLAGTHHVGRCAGHRGGFEELALQRVTPVSTLPPLGTWRFTCSTAAPSINGP